MKLKEWIITFADDDHIHVRAFSNDAAIILARAERIKQGKEYNAVKIDVTEVK